MPEDLAELWKAHHQRGEAAAREALVRRFIHLVRLTAGRISIHLPSHIMEEDLYSAGALGLLGAIDRFDPHRDVKFETFAITRIRGAILDELRQMDILGRGTRERIVRIRTAETAIREEGADLSLDALAERTGMTADEILDAERALRTANIASLDETRDEDGHTGAGLLPDRVEFNPTAGLEIEEMREVVDAVLDRREKMLVALYYHEGLTLKEIGEVMSITEGRVSQMHSAVLKKLRWGLERGKGKGKENSRK
jgi:RNA polymerase sigma factor for flagellar operon FliA